MAAKLGRRALYQGLLYRLWLVKGGCARVSAKGFGVDCGTNSIHVGIDAWIAPWAAGGLNAETLFVSFISSNSRRRTV